VKSRAAPKGHEGMARIPDGGRAAQSGGLGAASGGGARGGVHAHGADLHRRCPFHEDKTPSLVVTPAKNLWHCLGACQVGGTVIDWVMRAEGVSFRHAVELLQNDSLPLAAASSASAPPKQSTVRKLPTALERDAEDAKLLVQVIDYYHQSLLQSPEALAYLKRRGIGSEGGDPHVQTRLCQPHAGLSAAGEEPGGGRGAARASCSASGSCARADMSTSTARS
jgi:hypothetical protein